MAVATVALLGCVLGVCLLLAGPALASRGVVVRGRGKASLVVAGVGGGSAVDPVGSAAVARAAAGTLRARLVDGAAARLALEHASSRSRVSDRGVGDAMRIDPFIQQGAKLVADCSGSCPNQGTGEIGAGVLGYRVALSADGSTALVGAFGDNGDAGAVWVFTRSGGTWTQQGAKLVGNCTTSCAGQGTGEIGSGEFGYSLALSATGNTALIGAFGDRSGTGAVWVFTRSGSTWTQQGAKLVGNCTTSCVSQGTGEIGSGEFGYSVALSATGGTALIGGLSDANVGGAWVFTSSGGVWAQQGAKLVGNCTTSCANQGTGESGPGQFGTSVALSAGGNTAMVGAANDTTAAGAAWVFIRSAGVWAQQGAKLVGNCTTSCANQGTGEAGPGQFGFSVALSASGDIALSGGPVDGGNVGAAWLFTRSGSSWTQQSAKLVADCTTNCANQGTGEAGAGNFGYSVALSGHGERALISAYGDDGGAGAAWAFTSSSGAWTQQGAKLVADCTTNCANQGTGESGLGVFGVSVAVSADGHTALIGAPFDNNEAGAAWIFAWPVPAAPPTASITTPPSGATYTQGAVIAASFSCQAGARGVLAPGAAGCAGTVADGQPIDTATGGQHTFTVTATETDGQTTTVSRTYTVTAPPTASIATPPNGASYTPGQVVGAGFTCQPGVGGGVLVPGAAGCSGTIAGGQPIDTTTIGTHTFTVTATDTDGQTSTVSTTYTVADAPTASITTPPNGTSYAQGEVAAVSFSCQPGAGGALAPGAPGCMGTVADGQPIDTSAVGPHTFTVTASDTDGQTGTASSTYTVTAPPTASVTTPPNGASYTQGQLVDAGFSCQAGASALAGCTGTVANGQPIDTSAVGPHTFTVTASDTDGQTATASSAYTVTAAPPPPSGGGTGGSPCTPAVVGHVTTTGATARVPVTATGSSGTSCTIKLTLRVTETVRGGKVIAVRASTASRKTKKKIVVVGAATATIAAGQSMSLRISLNPTGKRLTAKRHKLKAKLVITAPSSGKSPVIFAATITFSVKSRHR